MSFSNKNPIILQQNDKGQQPEQEKNIQQIEVKIQTQENDDFRLDNKYFDLEVNFIFRIFFINMTKLSYLINKYVLQKNKNLDIKYIPKLHENEKVEHYVPQFEKFLSKLQNQKKITPKDIYNMVTLAFRRKFLSIHCIVIFNLICRQVTSIPTENIIFEFLNGNYTKSSLWVLLQFVLVLTAVVLQNQGFTIVQDLSAGIRLSLVNLLYRKTISMSNYQIQKFNVGKIFNMISIDLNSIEIMLYFPFILFYFPLIILVLSIVLYGRLEYYGLLCGLIIILCIPLQLFNGVKTAQFNTKKNLYADQRLKLINECVEGIRLIKLYGWETIFNNFINEIRQKELFQSFKLASIRTFDRSMSLTIVLSSAFIPILIAHYNGYENINSAKIYATLEQLYNTKNMLFFAGMGLFFIFQVKVILIRFCDFLNIQKQPFTELLDNKEFNEELFNQYKEKKRKQKEEEEQKQKQQQQNTQQKLIQNEEEITDNRLLRYIEKIHTIQNPQNQENAIEMEKFYGFWSKDQPPILKNINLQIKKNCFYGIVGKVGCGKTSLLQLFVEEMPFFKGLLRKQGSVAFVEQEPYIFSGKFIENVTFGKALNKEFYDQVIQACCLNEDLKQFPNGDMTEIGEKGVTLSGGQKARLSLARAIYSQSDIYLLDDPLSAVDAKVARNLHDKCIRGLLKGKTVILTTHQIQYTQQCDEVIILENGEINNKGTFFQIEQDILKLINQQTFSDQKNAEASASEHTQQKSSNQILKNEKEQNNAKEGVGKLFTKELDEKIAVSFQTYKNYLSLVKNKPLLIFNLILFFISEGLYTTFYYNFGSYSSEKDKDKLFYTSGIILLFFVIICNSKYILTSYIINRANGNLHKEMIGKLIRTKVQYFDQTPTGRILNKFSTDVGALDGNFSWQVLDIVEMPLQFTNILITLIIFNQYLLILMPFLIIALYFVIKYNKPLIMKSKTLDIIYKSPVFTFFSKSIQGIIHIRIYENIKYFLKQMDILTNNSIRTNYLFWNATRIISFNLQVITSVVILLGQITNIFSIQNVKDFGQSIMYLSMLIELVILISRQAITFDSNMSSVERALILCKLINEGELYSEKDKQLQEQNNNKSWIQKGEIKFENVFMKYRPELEYVLKGTSFTVKAGETIGCVGRTGAGKSSLLQVLFRMTNIEQCGKILIDGIDITTLGLNTLRSNISIIPQSPFLFSGTVRKNIDPLSEYTDEKVWEALQLADLKDTITQFKEGLNTDMSNAQSVFSTGQKQLICLARAILKNSKILVLDEATANVDMKTDEIIQTAIKKQFQGSTIFSIAHRLNTIADYDKVLVMDNGKVIELDMPFLLLVKDINDLEITSESKFAQMVKNSGEKNASIIFQIAKTKFLSVNNMREEY